MRGTLPPFATSQGLAMATLNEVGTACEGHRNESAYERRLNTSRLEATFKSLLKHHVPRPNASIPCSVCFQLCNPGSLHTEQKPCRFFIGYPIFRVQLQLQLGLGSPSCLLLPPSVSRCSKQQAVTVSRQESVSRVATCCINLATSPQKLVQQSSTGRRTRPSVSPGPCFLSLDERITDEHQDLRRCIAAKVDE